MFFYIPGELFANQHLTCPYYILDKVLLNKRHSDKHGKYTNKI